MFEDIFDDMLPDPKKSITDVEKHEEVWNSGNKEDIFRASDPDVWSTADDEKLVKENDPNNQGKANPEPEDCEDEACEQCEDEKCDGGG